MYRTDFELQYLGEYQREECRHSMTPAEVRNLRRTALRGRGSAVRLPAGARRWLALRLFQRRTPTTR